MLLQKLSRQAWQKHNNNSETDSALRILPARADVVKDALTYRLLSGVEEILTVPSRGCPEPASTKGLPGMYRNNEMAECQRTQCCICPVLSLFDALLWQVFPRFLSSICKSSPRRLFVVNLEDHLRFRRIILACTAFQIR
jgi:hypothetical protein